MSQFFPVWKISWKWKSFHFDICCNCLHCFPCFRLLLFFLRGKWIFPQQFPFIHWSIHLFFVKRLWKNLWKHFLRKIIIIIFLLLLLLLVVVGNLRKKTCEFITQCKEWKFVHILFITHLHLSSVLCFSSNQTRKNFPKKKKRRETKSKKSAVMIVINNWRTLALCSITRKISKRSDRQVWEMARKTLEVFPLPSEFDMIDDVNWISALI